MFDEGVKRPSMVFYATESSKSAGQPIWTYTVHPQGRGLSTAPVSKVQQIRL